MNITMFNQTFPLEINMKKKIILVFFIFAMEIWAEDDLVALNDDNFEHLTQAATGATSGDWSTKKDCKGCSQIEKELQLVAEELQGRLNVAKIDSDASRLTLRRFKIGEKPTLMFFRLGYQWVYNKKLVSKDIVNFVTAGFARERTRPVYKQLDRLDVWYEDFVKEMKASYKERRLPERDALLVTLAGGIVGFLILLYVFSSKKKNENENEKKKILKKKR